MINFIKGILGGIGNIVPGLSGAALLVIFGIYEKCIESITEIIRFKNITKNILFLLPIAIGITLGTILFGNIIKFFLDNWPGPTTYAFFGFILGTVPFLFKEANKDGFNKKYLIAFFITLSIGIILAITSLSNSVQLTNINLSQSIILGIVLSASTIIPGISSTVLLSIIGMYDVYLDAVSSVDILFLLPVAIGFIIGAILFAFLINFLFKKYYGYTFYAIIGFTLATIPTVLRGSLSFDLISLISIILLIITFTITYLLGKRSMVK